MLRFSLPTRWQDATGYDLVRVVLAAVLLVAAGLKGHQLATEPVLDTGFLDFRWLLTATVEFELFFGLWLLAGLLPRVTWAAALGCFGLFACVSLYKALSGYTTGGYFCRVPVNPWYTAMLDATVVLALLRWRPSGVTVSTIVPARALALLGGVMLAWLAIGAAWRSCVPLQGLAGRGTPSSIKVRSSPILIRPQPEPCLRVPEEDMRKIRAQVEPLDEAMNVSLYLHALRVAGLDTEYQRGKLASSRETLKLFADDEFSTKILGTPLIVRTPHGVRCAPEYVGGQKESHRDFSLAVLSEQGLPASFSIAVGDESFTLKDFLADSIANFHLGQEEIEWTALTYAMWLPPERTWVNKFGETFAFDQLATELMQRPLDKSVCVGSHVVQAMIVMARVDHEECPILSSDVRDQLMDRLAQIVREAEATQAADGSWGPDWYERLLDDRGPEPRGRSIDSRSVEGRLLATGHISEWLMLLPEGLRVSNDRFARSGRWLHAQLKGVDSEFVKNNFCPCTHGAIVLEMVRSAAGEIVVGRSRATVPISAHHGENVL